GSGKSTFLQALALALAGPRSTGFIPSLADWMSIGATNAQIRATLSVSDEDLWEPTLMPPDAWIEFDRPPETLGREQSALTPHFRGAGLDSFTESNLVSSVRSGSRGWFYAGYGPFRHLGSSGSWRPSKPRASRLAQQVSSLFDETVPLTDAVDWLIEQHLYDL